MPTVKQAYIWANDRTPDHTAVLVNDKYAFEAKACEAPAQGVWMFNHANVLGFFADASTASRYCQAYRPGGLLGLAVSKPSDAVTHWCSPAGKWFALRYLGHINDKALAVAPATPGILT